MHCASVKLFANMIHGYLSTVGWRGVRPRYRLLLFGWLSFLERWCLLSSYTDLSFALLYVNKQCACSVTGT